MASAYDIFALRISEICSTKMTSIYDFWLKAVAVGRRAVGIATSGRNRRRTPSGLMRLIDESAGLIWIA